MKDAMTGHDRKRYPGVMGHHYRNSCDPYGSFWRGTPGTTVDYRGNCTSPPPYASADAVADYRAKRENGEACDSPARPFPQDGKLAWFSLGIPAEYSGSRGNGGSDYHGAYDYCIEYQPGPGDQAWMAEKDITYITRLRKAGELARMEPAVWEQKEKERRVNNPQLIQVLTGLIQKTKEMLSTIQNDANVRLLPKDDRKALKSFMFFVEHIETMLTTVEAASFDNFALEDHISVIQTKQQYATALASKLIALVMAQQAKDEANASAIAITTAMRLVYDVPLQSMESTIFPTKTVDSALLNTIESDLRCPISQHIMIDPVSASDGQTYEREEIQKWLETNNTSPLTGAVLHDTSLRENHFARRFVDSFLTNNPTLRGTDEVYLSKSGLIALTEAIKNNNVQKTRDLLKQDHRFLAIYLTPNRSIFHMVCELGTAELLDCVLSELQPDERAIIMALPKPEHWRPQVLNKSLLVAAGSGNVAHVQQILALGAELDVKDSEGKTPLCIAAAAGQLAVVQLLLTRNANDSSRDCDGNAALDLAILKGHNQVVDLILELRGLPNYNPTTAGDLKYFSYMTLKLMHGQIKILRAAFPAVLSVVGSGHSTDLAANSLNFRDLMLTTPTAPAITPLWQAVSQRETPADADVANTVFTAPKYQAKTAD